MDSTSVTPGTMQSNVHVYIIVCGHEKRQTGRKILLRGRDVNEINFPAIDAFAPKSLDPRREAISSERGPER